MNMNSMPNWKPYYERKLQEKKETNWLLTLLVVIIFGVVLISSDHAFNVDEVLQENHKLVLQLKDKNDVIATQEAMINYLEKQNESN